MVNDLCTSPSMKALIPILTFRSFGCTAIKKVSEEKYNTYHFSMFLKEPCQLCRR